MLPVWLVMGAGFVVGTGLLLGPARETPSSA